MFCFDVRVVFSMSLTTTDEGQPPPLLTFNCTKCNKTTVITNTNAADRIVYETNDCLVYDNYNFYTFCFYCEKQYYVTNELIPYNIQKKCRKWLSVVPLELKLHNEDKTSTNQLVNITCDEKTNVCEIKTM